MNAYICISIYMYIYIYIHTHIHIIRRFGIARQDDNKSTPRSKTQTSLPGIIRQTPQTQTQEPPQNDQSQTSKPETGIQGADNNAQTISQTQTPNPIQRKEKIENPQENSYKTAGEVLDIAPGGQINKSVRLQEIAPLATQNQNRFDNSGAGLDDADLPVVGEVRLEDMQIGSTTKWKVIAQNGLLVMSK
jgi:hypothetical protein